VNPIQRIESVAVVAVVVLGGFLRIQYKELKA